MIVRGDGPLLARARFELVDTEAFLCSVFQDFALEEVFRGVGRLRG